MVGSRDFTSAAKKRELGDVLLEKGIVTPEILLDALRVVNGEENQKNRRNLPWVLVNSFKVDRDLLYREVANFYAFRTIDVSGGKITEEMIQFIRKEFQSLPDSIRDLAIEHHTLPLGLDPARPDRLIVVTSDPTSSFAVKIARGTQYGKFEICYLPLSQWEELWRRVALDRTAYADRTRDEGEIRAAEEADEDAGEFEQEIEDEISRSGLVTLVEKIMVDAVRVGASDIHIIPKAEKVTEFHFRVDGKLTLWYTHRDTRAEAVSAVVKDRAQNLDRFERSMAQDGFAQLLVDNKTIRFRVSVIPMVGKELRSRYESIVVRILSEPNLAILIEELGFGKYEEQALRRALAKPHGIVIVTGPTGSGKSTTLVAALRAIMDPSVNILTVEDPVEYFIEGARQVKLNPKLDFEGALRAILRHDPDIVMVGEMRDRITADIAIKLANTGHLTLSTLHTNDAPSAISRLYKMGVEPFLIGYAINLVLAQRLVRKLCIRCKRPVKDVDPIELARVGFTPEEMKDALICEPVGCSECIHGYRGRMAIHEALYFHKNIRSLILKSDTFVDEEALREVATKNGMRTLRRSGIDLVRRGITSAAEVASITMEED